MGLLAFAACACALLSPAAAAAEEAGAEGDDSGLSAWAEVDSVSRYLWRGLAWSRGPVVQPSAGLGAHGAEASVFANFVAGEGANQGRFDEVDYSASYTLDLDPIALVPLLTFYTYPNQADSPAAGEVGLRVELAAGPATVFTSHNAGLLDAQGSYFADLGLEYEMAMSDSLSGTFTWSLGYGSESFNEYYVGRARAAMLAYSFDAALEWKPYGPLVVRPHFTFATLVDEELRETVSETAPDGEPTLAAAGIAIGAEF